jgi:hypothetical protein
MTIIQSQAIWELCRQGFPLNADEAAERWEKGQAYRPDWRGLRVPRAVAQLIDQSNWEAAEGEAIEHTG